MRKLTLLIVSLLCYVGVLHAQALVADGVYTLSADENKQRGEMVAADGYDYPVLDGIDLSNYTGNSTAAMANGEYWYVQSVDASSNTYYIYNIAKGKYLVNENGNVNFGDNPYVWTFVTNANKPAYLNIKDASKTDNKVWLSSGCGRTASQRPVQWDSNNNDGGALYTFTRIYATPETGKFYKIKGDGELPWLTANATSGGNVVVSNDEADAGVFLKTQNGIQAVATGKYLGYSGGKYTYSDTELAIELRNTGSYLANDNNKYAVVSGNNYMFNNNNDGIVHESTGELNLPRLWAFIEVEAPAATVNGVLYETLQDAVDAAEAAVAETNQVQTLTLWKNSDETIELPIGVILEKNGFTADHVTDKQLTYVYNFVYGETVKATQNGPVTLGAAFPAINAEYKPFGVELTGVPEGNVALSDFNDEGKVIKDITVTISNLPFVAAADNASIENWYYIKMHSFDDSPTYNKHIQSVSATEVKWADNSVAAVIQDACTWGFVGNPYDGFKVVNYATGTAIAADGDAPVLNEAGVQWIVTASSYNEDAQHFCLKYPDEIKYLNANAVSGALGFYHDSDAGSTMWVTSRDINSEVTELTALVNQANDLVNDWSGKVGDLTEESKDAVAAAITTAQAAISSEKNLAVAKQGLEAAMENVQRIEAAAKIGDTLYASIEAALADAQAGQTVVLLKDTQETLVLPAGVKLDKSNVTAPNVNEAAAKIGDTLYASIEAAVDAAQAGDEVVVVADVADVVVDIDKNLTISGSATLNNVGLNANGADALTVKGLDFTGNSWINSGTAEALTVSGITANVAPVNTSYTNSRSAFISLGKDEAQQLALTVEDSKITVTSEGPDAILGWAAITEATIKNNVLKGSSDGYFNNADAVKFMAIADGAKFDISGNEIYSNYNGIVFAQNTTRDNAYSVEAAGNKFVGGADHIWIEVTGGDVTHATFNATSDNTVNGNAITANDIKYHSAVIKSWSSYAGIDVVTDADGKVIGGTLASFSNEESLADGFVFNENADGTYGVQFASYIVLPDDVNSSNYAAKFGDNTVTDGTNYYATLQAAVEAVAGQANAVLYCKPGADVGSLQHAPVTSTLTVYGNGADVTGDTERDFDLGNTDPSGGKDITADMTLTVKHLNGCGAWGTKATEHTVNLVFENCANMGKVFISGTTGTLNITMTDCAFEGVIKEAVYSNADGAITLTDVAFSNLNKAVNLNHKAAGTQTVTIDGCTFTNCGADVAADQIPVRVLSSVEGGKSVLAVTGSTFTGTPEGGADILLDYGVGLTTASVSGTAANVVVEKENNVGTTTAVKADETVEFTTALPVAQVGETKYMTLAEAVAAATEGATITMLGDVTEDVTLPAGVKFNGNGKAVGNLIAGGEITFTGVTKAASFNVEYTNTTVNIVPGASLEITGTGRMVIGHGCTFNITGSIEDAKTADVAALTPSLIMPGASFTGAGVTFNVTDAYIKAPSSYCSSSSSASGTFDFNIKNSIWESAGKLAFESQSVNATVYFDLEESVLNTGSHLIFGVSRGEVVIDNSNVNVGTARQIENQSTMTIKNGSVVNGAVATSSNAKNPGTLIVENATYAVTGEFSGSDLGTGTLIVKKGATVSAGSITKANIQIDATGMAAGDVINLTANLANLAGKLEVINNDLFEAKIVDGKIVLSSKSLAGEGTEDAPFVIDNLDDLRLFAMSVNAGNDYAGKYVKLGASVDLSAQAVALMSTEVTPNWEPIGTKDAPFKGTFDGNGETISNMIVVGEANQGFFGYADAATIKNLNLVNVTVTGTDCVGAVAGQVYSVSLIDNCHVSGNIKVEGQTNVGGITGKYYTKVSNCSVIGDGAETSYVKGVYVASDFEGDNIGGIMGHCGENNNLAGNTVKNITVSGTRKVGGIVGIADQNTDVTGCVVENVVVETTATAEYADSKVTSMSIAALIGQYQAAGSNPDGTVTGCTVKNVTFNNVNDVTVDVGPIVGGARGGSSGMLAPSTAVTASGNNVYMTTITGSTNDYLMVAVAKIGEKNYYVLDEALAAAQAGETVTLVNNVSLENPVVISGKALTLDLGAYTIEDKSTAVLTKDDDVWALIDLENGANLTVCGTGTIKANYANVQGGWTGMAYCINVDNTSKLTVDGGNFINGNGGVQTLGEVVVNDGTFVSHNGGTCIMATYTDAKVTVNGGTFKDSVEESDVYTGSGAVWAGFGAKIEINGGTFDFAADPEHENVVWTLFPAQNAIAGYGVNAEMAVSGGTFVNFNPAEDVIVGYSPSTGFTFGSVVAEGYTVVANGDGTYGVEEKVELPEVVITDIKGSLTDSDPDLTFALNFAIKDVENLDPEYLEKLFAQYGDWYTDYVLTISGLTDEDVTFNANGGGDGYLSGQYDAWSENWVSVPFEDVTLANGASIYIMEYAAKLMNKQGLRFTLAEVAEIVQNFDCGVYFTPEFLAANPGLKVDLHLKVFTEDAEGNKVNDINVATNNFDIEDYVAIVHAAGKQTQYCTTLADAVAAAADGATITMLRNVELTEAVKVVGKAITLDLNGKTVSGVCNSGQGHLVYIENGAGLTVKDGAVDGGGKLTYAQGTSNIGWTVAVMGNLTLESGTIELTGEWSIGYAVDVRPNAWGVAYTNPSVFTMNGGKLVSSDGAVRVASSSADQYANVSASFVMNGGEIDAAWDGVFIQQSNAAYDVLNFTINNGTIKGGLNPVRVYGPAPTSYVNGQECMSINFNGGTMTYTGTETLEWVIDGVLRAGGGSSIETIVENGNITASEAFAQAQALPDGYKWEQDGETYKVVEAPATGKISYRAYINDSESREAVQVDLENVYARNSLVVKLFDAEGNALTTTTLKQGGVEAAAYTCNIVLWGTASGSWDTEIHAEKLTVANYPQKGELWIDGNLVDTFDGILGNVTDAAAYQLPAYLALDCVYKEAKVGETYYATLADAVAAAEGETVTMLADVELTESLVIDAGKEVVLDLNGKTVSMADASGKAAYAIKNNGNLTIVDNSDAKTGKITFNSTTPDNSFGYATSTIGNGGSLTVESGTIENTTVGGASYAIDGIWHTDEASLTINGGTIVANKVAVRQVPFSATANNVVTVNGGTLTGATAGLQLFNINNDAKLAEVNIHGGEFNGTYAFYTSFTSAAASEDVTINIDGGEFNGYLYLYNGNNGSDEYPMTVSVTGGTFNGGAYIYTKDANGDEVAIPSITGGTFANDVTVYCVDGYLCEANGDGTYGIVVDPNYIAELVIDDAEGENYTNDTEKTVGKLTYKRTLAEGAWNPLYLPFEIELTDELLANYDFADYNQMISHDTNGDRVPDSFEMELFIYTGGTLDANYPYFVRPKNEEACSMNLVLTDATLYPANEISLVTSSVKNTFKLSGTYKAMGAEELAGKYAISIDGDWSYTSALKPYRLYFTITDNNGAFVTSVASKSIRIVVRGEDGYTGVEGVENENGEDMIFDLQGRRVLEPEKGGIYIKNGKKIIF